MTRKAMILSTWMTMMTRFSACQEIRSIFLYCYYIRYGRRHLRYGGRGYVCDFFSLLGYLHR
jgi:hypothetical protein